jgi:hypothetical protein
MQQTGGIVTTVARRNGRSNARPQLMCDVRLQQKGACVARNATTSRKRTRYVCCSGVGAIAACVDAQSAPESRLYTLIPVVPTSIMPFHSALTATRPSVITTARIRGVVATTERSSVRDGIKFTRNTQGTLYHRSRTPYHRVGAPFPTLVSPFPTWGILTRSVSRYVSH